MSVPPLAAGSWIARDGQTIRLVDCGGDPASFGYVYNNYVLYVNDSHARPDGYQVASTPGPQDPIRPVEIGKSETAGYVTKDSGQREAFATGSVRDTTAGKGSFTSISPHMLNRLAQLLERGAKKYGLFNYQKGQPFSRIADSLMRHTNQARLGDESEDHKSAIIFNAMAWIHFEEEIKAGRLPADLNDLPKYG